MFEQHDKLKFSKPLLVFLIVAIAMLGAFYFWQKEFPKPIKPPPSANVGYAEAYRLVSREISQSAPIIINLPPGLDKSLAKRSIQFHPEIEGKWLTLADTAYPLSASSSEPKIVFKPKQDLRLNTYYSVQLTVAHSEPTVMKADFKAVENPKIIAIFPQQNSEAPEDSEITIVFNRPMVALTTLDFLEKKDVPVEITPATEGRFKWITTRNLKFIPKHGLRSSSHYKVKIRDGLTSMEGLALRGTEREFITRKLRYLNFPKGSVVYNQPISIYFNQPVDLPKTIAHISLFDVTTKKEIPFIAQYLQTGKEDIGQIGKPNQRPKAGFGLESADLFTKLSNLLGARKPVSIVGEGEEKTNGVNKAVIQIYNKRDRLGREKFWDFEHHYRLSIDKAVPLEGDIILQKSRSADVYASGIIKDISAQSERTAYATPDFFDLTGKLWVTFYEEIDLQKSKITATSLKEIGYGKKCKDQQQTISSSIECQKVPDKKRIYMTFYDDQIGFNQRLELNFQKLVNTQGKEIYSKSFKRYVTSFPRFKILSVFPQNNSTGASLVELSICSNSPILAPDKKDFDNYFSANRDYELNSWGTSFKVTGHSSYYKCDVGQFETRIHYGLMPLSDYSIQLNLEDVFGQQTVYSWHFTTGDMPSGYLSFYHFQDTYDVTPSSKTKLKYAVQNMEYVNMEICKLGPKQFLHYLEYKPRYYEGPLSNITSCQKVARERIELPSRYWLKDYFTIDIQDYFKQPLGHYILTFSHPNYKHRRWDPQQKVFKDVAAYERTYLSVTNLAASEKRIRPIFATYGQRVGLLSSQQLKQLRNLYWVVNISNLEPVFKAKVDLFKEDQNQNLVLINSYNTDGQGLVFTNAVKELKGVIITKDGDSTVLPAYESRLNYAGPVFSQNKVYIYTDKPIYRPQSKVFIKGIFRRGFDANYELPEQKTITLRAYNSKRAEILNRDLTINDFGTFNTQLVLDKTAPLGTYRVCVARLSCAYFDVQKYVPAPFSVQLKTDKKEYISKDTVHLDIAANYYFGVPLEAGTVFYTISSQNYYFDRYSDGYFNFGSSWYWRSAPYYGEKFLLRGQTKLNRQGRASISQLLDFEKLFKDEQKRKSKIIVVDVTVRDSQGRSVSSQKSFIVHRGEFYLGQSADKSFLAKNETTNIKIKSVDIQGKEVPIKNIVLSLYKKEWLKNKRLGTDGRYYYQWKEKKTPIQRFNFGTDSNGNYTQAVKFSQEGSYQAEVTALDKRGNLISSSINLYVYGEKEVSIKPSSGTKLEVEAQKTKLNVGDSARLIIKSPYKRAKALICLERSKIFNCQTEQIKGNLYNFDFKIKPEYIPNVYATVLLLSSEPAVKFAKVGFEINTDRKKLDITVQSNKRYYLPGEEVTLDILATDHQKQPVSAEVSVSVVDLSVLALKGNPKKNPLIFFYQGLPLAVSTASNIKDILKEIEVPRGKGGGGGRAMPKEPGLAQKKRGIFRETAFWSATVRTNKNGRARVKFTLPDNLTTWQAETLGITKDTKLGINYQEFISKKELMLVPLKPRFIVPGDVFYIGAKIFNQSKESQSLNITFSSQTIILKEAQAKKKITIKPNDTQTVYFRVEAPGQIELGEHQFVLSAKGKKIQDTVEQSISIRRNNTYEVTATANYTPASISKEYVFLPDNVLKDKGRLSIKSSATLAVFLSDGLNYLLQFPYGCSEQIASKLNAIAIIKRGLNVPNMADKFRLKPIIYDGKKYSIDDVVSIGLAKLYNNQGFDGGFSFWQGGKSDFYLTLHVAEALYNLSLAGFDINQDSLSKATAFLYKKITTDEKLYEDRNTLILAAYTLLKLPHSAQTASFLKQKLIDLINDDLFIREQISNTSLAYLAVAVCQGFKPELKNKVFEVLDNRIDIDARGAFLGQGKNKNKKIMWQYYETPIKDTALYLKAQVANRSKNPIIDKVLRWLLNSRAKDGTWGSTNNTISVIDALVDFLQWKRETESNFSLKISVDDKTQGGFDFRPETILGQFRKEIPLNALEFNKNNTIEFLKTNHNELPNNLYYDLSLKYFLPAERIPPRDEGFSITRDLYRIDDIKNKNPVSEAHVGQILRGHLQITVPKSRNFVAVEDYIPAGMEIVNLDLSTEQKSLRLQEKELKGRELRPDFKEIHDDRVFLFKERLGSGVYEFDYYLRALVKGKFHYLPAQVSEMYFPENFGRTNGRYFTIK